MNNKVTVLNVFIGPVFEKVRRADQFWRIVLLTILVAGNAFAQPKVDQKNPDLLTVRSEFSPGAFPLVFKQTAAALYFDAEDYEVVKIAAKDLQGDIEKVSHTRPELVPQLGSAHRSLVIIGTVGKCKALNDLAAAGKISLDDLKGQWESFKLTVVQNPLPGVEAALVIAGSDRRGTAFGVYELSRCIGVSPWYYWADVPIEEQSNIWIQSGAAKFGPPSVKYRGMFINDERHALQKWAAATQDPNGIGENTLKHVFELLLRLKANCLWRVLPASLAKIADDYAIVMGSPHNQNMFAMSWKSEKAGEWLYHTNQKNIYDYWDRRTKELAGFENVYTVGMRGAGDLPMGGGLTTDEIVALMETIIADQRKILTNNIAKPIDEIPQILVLYKEVLELYNQGIKVPKDVTLVWPDDNYGYIQRLSNVQEQARTGGAGIYYHLSYLGRPQSYLWLSTINPVLMWEELRKAYDFDARKIWVFNVGDIKPAEYSFSLAMDMAWDISKFNRTNINEHVVEWMGAIFGKDRGQDIGAIMDEYYRLAFERKPEFMNWDRIEPSTPIIDTEFSFVNYHEAERRLDASKRNWERAAAILKGLDAAKRPAFFELVYYPVAGAYFTDARTLLAQKNRLYARQGRASANQYADQAEAFLKNAEEATQDYYDLLNGKWTKVIVTNGRSDKNFMPPLTRIENTAEPAMGLAIEGDEEKLMVGGHDALPWFDSIYKKKHDFEVFNRGLKPFGYRISASDDWIKTSRTEGSCGPDARIEVEIDYDRLAKADGRKEKHEGSITISGAGATRTIDVIAFTPASVQLKDVAGRFVEEGGCISINAENFQRTHDGNGFGWKITPHLGVTGASIGAYPFSATPVDFEWKLEKEGACAEYDFYSFNRGWVDVYTYALPTAPINSQRHSLYAVSIDKGAPLIVDFETQLRSEAWKQNVQRNQSVDKTRHFIKNAGQHTLKLWMIDTGVFIDKIVMDFGGLKQSYMGPEQTRVE